MQASSNASSGARWRLRWRALRSGLATEILQRSGAAALVPPTRLLIRGPAHATAVCLTFDDGPHPEYTPRLLDALRVENVRATFFIIGREAERYTDLVRRTAAEGHAVANHSYTHADPARTSARQLIDEIRRTDALLEGLLGTAKPLFRPPHGWLTWTKLIRVWRAERTIVLWNANPNDFSRANDAEVRTWFRDHPLRGGDVVLMHDNHPHAAEVIPDLAEMARRQGLSFAVPTIWIT